jgi:hypothetical protein
MPRTRNKTSPLWNISKEKMLELISKCNSITEVLSYFKLKNKGDNSKTLKAKLLSDNISFLDMKNLLIANYKNKISLNGFKKRSKELIDFKYLLTENSTVNRTNLKERLLENNILKNECSICGQLPIWNNKPLSLHIDHINGISDDNRLENLRILCPHCHSQTDTFAGRNNKKKLKPLVKKKRIPSKEILEELLNKMSIKKAAIQMGFNEKTIMRFMKKYNLTIKENGFWIKKENRGK